MGQVAVVGCGMVSFPWSARRQPSRPRSSAAVSSQCSSITRRARSGRPRCTAVTGCGAAGGSGRCWPPARGSISISCSDDCTDVTASMVRGEPVSAATVRWKSESACRCSAGRVAAATVGSASLSRSTCCLVERRRSREVRRTRLDDPAELQGVEPVPALLRGDAGRPPGVRAPWLGGHDRAARAATRGLHEPGLPQRGHRLAQGGPADREPVGELALGRERAAHRVDAEADRARRAARRRPRTRGGRAPGAAPTR